MEAASCHARRRLQLSSARILPACLLLVVSAGTNAAAVEFDFPRVIGCRDVTTPEFAHQHPDQRVIELGLRLSVRFHAGDAEGVEELSVDVDGWSSGLRVHRFSPATELASELSCEIVRTTTKESHRSLEGTLGGGLPIPAGELVAHVTPSISGAIGRRESATEETSRLPPKHTVIVSGTTRQSHGVFFKLKRYSQTTLEGVHEMTIQFVAPAGWKTSTLHVACGAHGQHKLLGLVEQYKSFGRMIAPVQLYLAGDAESRALAERRAQELDPCRRCPQARSLRRQAARNAVENTDEHVETTDPS